MTLSDPAVVSRWEKAIIWVFIIYCSVHAFGVDLATVARAFGATP